MIRHDKLNKWLIASKNHVATVLPTQDETYFQECFDTFSAGDPR